MFFCRECGKKATKNLHIDSFTSTCTKCATTKIPEANENSASVIISDDKKLSEIPFSQFQLWIQLAIRDTIQSELKVTLEKYTKEIESVKKDLNAEKEKVTSLTTKVNNLSTELTELKTEHEKTKKVGEANLKYLINLDRNSRKHNVMIFGLPERDELVVGRENDGNEIRATNDDEKVSTVLSKLDSDMSCVSNFHRMGKPGGDRPRPVKVILKSTTLAHNVLSKSKNLKNWESDIYVKPDKTKKEAEEFKRIGKRKADLLLQHPTTDPNNPIVTLTKGILRVNGTEVDKYNPIQSLF